MKEPRKQLPKPAVRAGGREGNGDRGAPSGHADISCASLTLLCGLHKFHSELLSMKLMKSQAVQQKAYQPVVFHGVRETSAYRRCASSRAGRGVCLKDLSGISRKFCVLIFLKKVQRTFGAGNRALKGKKNQNPKDKTLGSGLINRFRAILFQNETLLQLS